MTALTTRETATPREAGTRPAAGDDEGFPGRRSRRPEHGAQAARRGDESLPGRYPARPETRT